MPVASTHAKCLIKTQLTDSRRATVSISLNSRRATVVQCRCLRCQQAQTGRADARCCALLCVKPASLTLNGHHPRPGRCSIEREPAARGTSHVRRQSHSCVRGNDTHNHFRLPLQLPARPTVAAAECAPAAAPALVQAISCSRTDPAPTAATGSCMCIMLQPRPMLTSRCWPLHPP